MSQNIDQKALGSYSPSTLKLVEYGVGSISKLAAALRSLEVSKVFIVTGQSITNKTSIVNKVAEIIDIINIVAVYSDITQHAPIKQVQEATKLFEKVKANGIIAIGGGSPIDSAKLLSYRIHANTGIWVPVIAIPTTLSVAETTAAAGFTNENGDKVTVMDAEIAPKLIIYDAALLKYTPPELLLSSAIRALDHAIETLYHRNIAETPYKPLALYAIGQLFHYLPKLHDDPTNLEAGQALQNNSFLTLFPRRTIQGGFGPSHSLGHALGATYGIPHGITSCITLAAVVKWKAQADEYAAAQLVRVLPYIGLQVEPGLSQAENAAKVSDALIKLLDGLGLSTRLENYNVPTSYAHDIALRALHGNASDPDLAALTNLVKTL
ncbi:hypothetical protein V1514DRAFT_332385 [Lipomyces japonicus]|uniref:uncharacterized protein n=1 Tax=Lipomyces japonicus TaxID=56871 RepID=UPI0034CE4EB4